MAKKTNNSSKSKQKKSSILPIMESPKPSPSKGKRVMKPCSRTTRGKRIPDPVIVIKDDVSEEEGLDDNYCSEEMDIDYEDYSFGGSDDEDVSRCRQLNYSVLNEDEIRQRQEEDITAISNVLSVSRVQACLLLCYYNWSVNKVNDAWFADEEKVRKMVGLLERPIVGDLNLEDLTCGICFEQYSRTEMYDAACGHLFCSSCWKGYISTAINDGPGCLMLRCPDPKCGAAVDKELIDTLVSDEEKEKYSRYLLRTYVEASKMTKWCPAPGCDYAVEFDIGSECFDVSCNCRSLFCWNCLEDAHRPVNCDTVSKWVMKNTAEAENTNWILANSKPCPKCKRPIEKNHGCMHMTCTPPCKFQFCWLCLGDWSEHGKKTGGFYACNRYETGKKEGAYEETEKKREMAKKSLERYTHYYERWAANQKSRVKAVEDLQQMQSVNIEKLSSIQCQLVSQMKFVTDAWEQIVECRRVLKWTYAYGYYIPENDDAKRQFFEYVQGEAESGLERLHKCAEKDLQVYLEAEEESPDFDDFRIKLTELTNATRKFFENLVQALENGLADVASGSISNACSSSNQEVGKKGKGGKGKAAPARSRAVHTRPRVQEPTRSVTVPQVQEPTRSATVPQVQEPTVSITQEANVAWTCEHCTYYNANGGSVCHMCSRPQISWTCGHCTYLNAASFTECQMCDESR